jgi:hypothetical protein
LAHSLAELISLNKAWKAHNFINQQPLILKFFALIA